MVHVLLLLTCCMLKIDPRTGVYVCTKLKINEVESKG